LLGRVAGRFARVETRRRARAHAAAARGDWQQAYDLFMADADGVLARTDLPTLGEVAYAAGHLDVTIEAWERAYSASMQAGDPLAAAGAAVRVAMHLLFDTALMAPVRGWLARAERLLDGPGETSTHAWSHQIRSPSAMTSALSLAFSRGKTWWALGRSSVRHAWVVDPNGSPGEAPVRGRAWRGTGRCLRGGARWAGARWFAPAGRCGRR
jgi:hypothetical protein